MKKYDNGLIVGRFQPFHLEHLRLAAEAEKFWSMGRADEALKSAGAARSLGMTPFIEVRDQDDLRKLTAAAADGPVLSGVNARDLATFAVDPLAPVARLESGAIRHAERRRVGARIGQRLLARIDAEPGRRRPFGERGEQ